jgi:hypothetical protein
MISQAEAAGALRDIEASEARALEARGYAHASPQLILWGIAWIVGYTLTGLVPVHSWGWVWLSVDLAGLVGSAILARCVPPAGSSSAALASRFFWPSFLVMLAAGAFLGAVFYIFGPASTDAYLIFPALLLGLIYVVIGAWRMHRTAWIGAAIFLLSFLGFLFLKPFLSFWIAAVGGGGLVLGGLWLRKA